MSTPAAQRLPHNKWWIALSVTFGTLMGTIDASIVNVATPHLRGAMGATVQEITWVTTGFVIANVVVMPLTAFLGRLFGQKRVYLAALIVFIVGSALCGLAHSLSTLVVFRVLQGLGAGALQPTEQAILRQSFPPEEQGMAMALFGVAVVIGPAFGPTLGGYIIDNYSWEWIFYINLPVGCLALFMVSRFVHEPEDIRLSNQAQAEIQRRSMDWAGIGLLALGVATLQYVLEEGSRLDWFDSTEVVALSAVSLVAMVGFIVRELTAPVPAVRIRLFADRVFATGTIIGAVMFAMLLSVTFLLPVFMQEMLGFTAVQAGVALMPRALVMVVMMPIVGKLYNRVSARLTVTFGALLFVLSAYIMSHYTLATSTGDVVWVLLLQGVAFSCLFIPVTTVALASIPRHSLADATGLNALLRQIGGSIGLAVFASFIPRFTQAARSGLVTHLAATNPAVTERLGSIAIYFEARGYDAVQAEQAAVRVLARSVMQQATVLTFERLFFLAGVVFLLVLPLVILLKTPAPRTAPALDGAAAARAAEVDTHLEM